MQPRQRPQRGQCDGADPEQRGQHLWLLARRHERRRTEHDHQQHRQLDNCGRCFHQPRHPRVQALQEAPRRAPTGAERNLIDHIGRKRAQMEEQLVQRRQCMQAARAEA